MKYQVLFIPNWNVCTHVVIKNRAMKVTAAAKEGL
jgi:hypothetical protein